MDFYKRRWPRQRTLKQLGSCFKKTLHATEQDSESIQKLRTEFRTSIGRESAANIIILDEGGTSREMIRRYGRGPVGVPVHSNLVGGDQPCFDDHGRAATGGDVFLAYMEHELCPLLMPGHIVVVDNLSAST